MHFTLSKFLAILSGSCAPRYGGARRRRGAIGYDFMNSQVAVLPGMGEHADAEALSVSIFN